ncbi:MAG: hypothetical protein Q7S00_01410 [bacterium]|nr:hypothetical protein [bacterium]
MKRLAGMTVLCFFLFAGCNATDLHHNLLESDADEILVLLHQNGINAKKEKEVSGQEVSWKISVPRPELPEARRLLVQNNLPRRRELGLSGVYKEKGLIPTPDEQKARFLLALKGEIVNSLRSIPGVVDADVVLNIPKDDEFSLMDEEQKRPTASVVLRIGEDDPSNFVTEAKIQRFVANTVPNLDPNNVAVIITRRSQSGRGGLDASETVPTRSLEEESLPTTIKAPEGGWKQVAGLRMDSASFRQFRLYALTALFGLMILSVALIINVVRLNRLKQKRDEGMESPTALPPGEKRGGFLPPRGGEKVK